MLGRMSHRIVIHHLRYPFLVSVLLLVCSNVFLCIPAAYAQTRSILRTTATCPSPAAPTSQSLLIVLLDRSGSLIADSSSGPPTDPNLYSTSVTKALADLWPGDMAVIPFSNGSTQLLGPATLTDPTQQAELKEKIEKYPIGGDTPLRPAVQGALDLLKQRNYPAGSRVIVITDGNPTGEGDNDGPHQEQAIRNTLIGQFCQRGVPVTPFGLTINPNSADGQDATKLLNDIAVGTATTYTNVKGPEDLAREVISLYAQWQGLTFTPVSGQGGNYPLSIDNLANRVSIVAFRSDSKYGIKLVGPDQKVITQGIQTSTDRHYTIDNLLVGGATVSGNYTVTTGGDPNAQVYSLVSSPLKIQLVQPTTATVAYADKPVQIQVRFADNNGSVTPAVNDASAIAKVTLVVNGQTTSTNTVVLTQEKTAQGTLTPIFSGGTEIYNQPGTLQIEIDGTYQQAKRQTSFSLSLLKPVPPAQKPKPTQKPNLLPAIIAVGTGIGILALLGLLLLFFLRWRSRQPKPYGYVTNGRRGGDVALNTFSKPVVSSHDIQTRGVFNFPATFELLFTKDGTVRIRSKSSEVTIDVQGKPRPEQVTAAGLEIRPGRKIYMNGRRVASFENAPGVQWSQN